MSLSRICGKKVRFDWVRYLFSLKSRDLFVKFYAFRAKHRLSDNRCAYYVLKKHYSTIIKPGYVDKFMFEITLRNPNYELL